MSVTVVQRNTPVIATNKQTVTTGLPFTIGGAVDLQLDSTAFTNVGRSRYAIFKYGTSNLTGSLKDITPSFSGTSYSRFEGYGTFVEDTFYTVYYITVS